MTYNIDKAREAIANANALIIGASNGLSIAEGYNIFADNEMFRSQFGDFRDRYGIRSVLQGCFFDYPTADERKRWNERLIKYWITDYQPSDVMKNLRSIVGDKPYFIVTTNADTHLELSGFDADRVWELEGTFLSGITDHIVTDKQQSFNDFIARYANRNVVIIELGIGSRNTLIKQPLMRLTAQLPQCTYITLNLPQEIYIPGEISSKSIALPGDLSTTLQDLLPL